jgi:hypothetical protein
MFKIKKNPKKMIGRDPLLETNPNEASSQTQKYHQRPQSVRLTRKNISHHTISHQTDKQGKESARQQGTVSEQSIGEVRLLDREYLTENVRRLSAAIFKDRISVYGEFKENLIKRVSEKAFFKAELSDEHWQEGLKSLIVSEMEKLERARELQKKCDDRTARIENMLVDRLAKLSALR